MSQRDGASGSADHERSRVPSIIDAVAYAAIALLRSRDVEEDIPEVLRMLGESAGVSRIYIYQVTTLDGELADTERFEWTSGGIQPTLGPEDGGHLFLPDYERYVRLLGTGGFIAELAEEAPPSERAWLDRDEVLSYAVVPIFVRDGWWGYIGFDDCWTRRRWSAEELSSLRVAAETVGAALERQELDYSLAEIERRYRTFIEQAPDIVVYADHPVEGSNTSYVSPQINDILGVTPEEWMEAEGNDLWISMLHPDDRDRAVRQYEEYLRGGPDLDDYRLVRPDGRAVWIRDRARIVPGPDGEPVEWGVMMDVTDRLGMEARLREAEARYRALVEQLPAVAYTEDVDGRTLYMSPRSMDVLGVAPERWVEDPNLWSDLLVEEDRQRTLSRAQNHTKASRYVDEYRLRRPDGAIVWIRDEAMPISDPDGRFTLWQGLMIDVTEQKRAEALVREAEGRLRTLVEQIAAVTYLESPSPSAASLTYISPQIRDLLGYSPEEWMADPDLWETSIHPDDRERTVAAAEEAARTQRPFLSEHRMMARDGRIVWVRDEGHMVSGDGGDPPYWLGLIVDTTEQHEAMQKLQEAETRFQVLVEEIPVITYIDAIDEDGSARYISPQIETILGRTQQEWLSDPMGWERSIHPDDHDRLLQVFGEASRSLEPYAVDYRVVATDGRIVWLHEEAHVVRDEGGRPLYWLGAASDISARKETEDLERALELEKEATAKLRALDEMKDQFLAGVSHDLRTPLASILGFALTLERSYTELSDEERLEFASRISANSRKLKTLVDDLLDVHRLNQGVHLLRLSRVDLGPLVARAVEQADYLEGREVGVTTESVVVRADETKVLRMVENLLVNTSRHTPPGTRVWANVVARDGEALISVEDDGPGVPDADKHGLFDQFTTGTEARESGSPGLGVGLSLVARFAELHGGRAWVEDRPGGGSRFCVSLPESPPGA